MKRFYILLLTLFFILGLTSFLSANENIITVRLYGAVGITVGKDDRVISGNPLNYRGGGQGLVRLFSWLSIGVDSSYIKVSKITKVKQNYNGYNFKFDIDLDISYVNVSGVLEFHFYDGLVIQAGVGPYFYIGEKIGISAYEMKSKEIGIFFSGGSDLKLSEVISIPIIGRIDVIFAESNAYVISVLSGISFKF